MHTCIQEESNDVLYSWHFLYTSFKVSIADCMVSACVAFWVLNSIESVICMLCLRYYSLHSWMMVLCCSYWHLVNLTLGLCTCLISLDPKLYSIRHSPRLLRGSPLRSAPQWREGWRTKWSYVNELYPPWHSAKFWCHNFKLKCHLNFGCICWCIIDAVMYVCTKNPCYDLSLPQ